MLHASNIFSGKKNRLNLDVAEHSNTVSVGWSWVFSCAGDPLRPEEYLLGNIEKKPVGLWILSAAYWNILFCQWVVGGFLFTKIKKKKNNNNNKTKQEKMDWTKKRPFENEYLNFSAKIAFSFYRLCKRLLFRLQTLYKYYAWTHDGNKAMHGNNFLWQR